MKEAAACWTGCIIIDPEDALAHFNRGNMRLKLSDNSGPKVISLEHWNWTPNCMRHVSIAPLPATRFAITVAQLRISIS
jgi:hypothetical protein